jgi:lysophospholipase L1-like esterase
MYVFDQNLKMNVPRAGYEIVGSKVSIKINSLGFRGDEIARSKPPGTLRIVCTGASTTFCEEVSGNEATWPAQLEKRLRARYPDQRIEVINAGITGSAIDSSLKDVRGRLLSLQPDLVILYRANNDIVLDTRDLAIDRGLVQPAFSRRSGPWAVLARYSLLVHLARTNIDLAVRPRQKEVRGHLNAIPPDLPKRFIHIMGKTEDELRKRNVSLLLSTFVVKFRREQPRDTQMANARLAFYHMPWASMEDLIDVFDVYNSAIIGFASSRGIPVVTDVESIPADDEHFVDYMHFTDAGCEAMARRMGDFIEQKRLLDALIAKRKQ